MTAPEIERLTREVAEAKARLVAVLAAHVAGTPTNDAIDLFDRYLEASRKLNDAQGRLQLLDD